jgi:hypothetical protein
VLTDLVKEPLKSGEEEKVTEIESEKANKKQKQGCFPKYSLLRDSEKTFA